MAGPDPARDGEPMPRHRLLAASAFVVFSLALAGHLPGAAAATRKAPPAHGRHAAPHLPRPGRAVARRRTKGTRSASSSSVTDLAARGECNYYEHTNRFGASVTLNTQRFPQGARVWFRYAYARIGASGWTYQPWQSTFVNNVSTAPIAIWGGDMVIVQPIDLAPTSFPVRSGSFVALVLVAINAGSGWEYTWTYGDGYALYGQYGIGASSTFSTCQVSA
jgi:hypothetical protein